MEDCRCDRRAGKAILGCIVTAAFAASTVAAEPAPSFFRGVNLNGPAVTIDGYRWEGSESKHYVCNDKAFENQKVTLVPPTDVERARMIRSSRWGGNRIELTGIPSGTYSVFLYVWEDNNAESYSISVNGRQVMPAYYSGETGHWEKLGPWYTSPQDGKIVLTSIGGAANFSGIELWHGRYDGINEPIGEEQLAFFEKRIRPLLIERCYECHSAKSDDLEGELLVDSRASIRRGGDSGPAIVPGNLEQSLLIEAVRYANDELQMPPDERLTDAEIADLEHWVKIGAPDPRSTATRHLGKQIDIKEAREFWSLRPIADPPLPKVDHRDWPQTDIDRFILAKLEELSLRPTADTDKRTLIRRATYDLTGLPPTPQEVEAFLADTSAQAFARVVDRLLASPRYGERWGRHWLDVVRYADTAGDNSDYPIPQMYRYRNWVIDALNRDMPFDEFVRDQLAGDLRGGDSSEQRLQRIVATGYLAGARRFGSRVDDYPWHLTYEDTIDNLGRALLGITLSCSRCHDHKFDPVTTRDYYALYGIFASTRFPWPGIELDKRQRDFVPLVPPSELAEIQRAQAERQEQQTRLDNEVKRLKELRKETPATEKEALEEQLKQAERRAKEYANQPPLFETAYAVAEANTRQDAAVQIKGDPAKRGDIEPRHFLTVLGGQRLPESCGESGRRELAQWIVDRDNPLTARVLVNRIWQYHFGRGIVPTPNDFGKQGKPPTHPLLLDYLAVRFRESGWSIKSMHRLIMLSRVYRQSSLRERRANEIDPANEYLAGFPRQRLDAESIRDALLALGGNLDLSTAGPHPFPPQNEWDFTQHKPFKAVYESNHRSIYLMTQRIQRHPMLAIFDGADPSTSTAVRMTSTTPLQALFLLNDPQVHQQSRRIAQRVMAASSEVVARIDFAYQLLFARRPEADETAAARHFLADAEKLLLESGVDHDQIEAEAWQAWVRSLLRLNEFVYLD